MFRASLKLFHPTFSSWCMTIDRCVIENCVLEPMAMMKVGNYTGKEGPTMQKAITLAMKRTKGLKDLGDTAFLDSYANVMESAEWQHRKEELTTLGYFVVQENLTETMIRRLKMQACLKTAAGKAISQVAITEPIFVLGLPRTGTTFLHRLLSLDTARFRAPLLWELLFPVPEVPLDAGPYLHARDRAARMALCKEKMEQFKGLGLLSKTQHIHEVGARSASRWSSTGCRLFTHLNFHTSHAPPPHIRLDSTSPKSASDCSQITCPCSPFSSTL